MFHTKQMLQLPTRPHHLYTAKYDIDDQGFILYHVFNEDGELSVIHDVDYDYIEQIALEEQRGNK